MEIGICGPAEFDPAPAGADYLEPTVDEFLMPSLSDRDYQAACAKRRYIGRTVPALNYLFPPEMKSVGPDADTNMLDDRMDIVLTRAGGAGVGVIVYGSGPSRMVPAGYMLDEARDQLISNLRRWGAIAARNSVTIVLEHLNRRECNIVTSVAEAAEIVNEVGEDSVRLLIDTYHMAVEGEPASEIRKHAGLVVHAHAAEATDRNPVGTNEDHRPYFRALKDIGYAERISVEASWKSLPDQALKAVSDLRHQYRTA